MNPGPLFPSYHLTEQDQYLRVVTLSDRETVHNALFDRGFQEKPS
jgi:hypothetical protein